MPSSSRSTRVDARDHVPHDLRRRVPDAQAACAVPGRRLPGTARRNTERRALPRSGRRMLPGSTRFSVAPVQIEDVDQSEALRAAERGEFARRAAIHRHLQIPAGQPPVEAVAISTPGFSLVPEHPGREDAVKEGLHEGRAEEVLASRRFELERPDSLRAPAGRYQLAQGSAFSRALTSRAYDARKNATSCGRDNETERISDRCRTRRSSSIFSRDSDAGSRASSRTRRPLGPA